VGQEFFSRFIGRTSKDLAGVEAVSGATISSQAVIDDVRTAATAVFSEISGQSKTSGAERFAGSLPLIPAGAIIIMIALCSTSVVFHAKRLLRCVTLLLSVVVIGIWLNTPITIGDIVDVRNLSLSWTSKLPVVILMFAALIAAFWRGNLYCAYLCPFGALQEGAAKILPVKCDASERMRHSLSWLRWIVAIGSICAIAAMGSYAFREMEPFATCFLRSPERVTIIQTCVVLVAALFIRRVWCRNFCPTGLVLDLIALLGARARHVVMKSLRRARMRESSQR
jgi:NosR/NirI family transcriptional regulator, nitrous oxide reductase regulator